MQGLIESTWSVNSQKKKNINGILFAGDEFNAHLKCILSYKIASQRIYVLYI